MNTKNYSELTDSALVVEVLTRYGLTQQELADMLFVTQQRISKAKTGVNRLRPVIRKQLISMLERQDNAGND